jgi:hypothetical protein
MSQAVLSEIEQRILESGLSEMAADEEAQKELKGIAADFHETELDGGGSHFHIRNLRD